MYMNFLIKQHLYGMSLHIVKCQCKNVLKIFSTISIFIETLIPRILQQKGTKIQWLEHEY